MADDQQDESQKTEEPTPKKLDESRRKGQVAVSREVNTWFMLLGGTIVIVMMAPDFLGDLKRLLAALLAASWDVRLDGGAGGVVSGVIRAAAGVMLLPLGILVVLAAVGSLIQNGPMFAPESIKPKLEKISIGGGVKRLFSSRSLMEFVKGLLKLAIVGTVATLVILPELDGLDRMPSMAPGAFLDLVWRISSRMLIAVLAVVTVIAGLDMLYQRMAHMKQLRMSRQEIKDEFKQSEGDPMVKAKLRQIRTERARQRMMQAVPDATVVVTNPTHFAVALKYEHDGMSAPEVVAKGADLVAQRIREKAAEHGVPLVENPPLARALFAATEIGDEVPPEHYRAVAEVIGYIMKLRPRRTRPAGRA